MRMHRLAALVLVFVTRTSFAQTPAPPPVTLAITGSAAGPDIVTIHRVDRNPAFPDADCALPCTMVVPAGRYEVVSVDADLHEHRHPLSADGSVARLDLDTRVHSDRAMLGVGVGLVTFGAIAITGGAILLLGGLHASSTSSSNAQAFMAMCRTSTDGSPTAVMNCCMGITATNPTGSNNNFCTPTDYSTDYVVGGISIGVGLVGVIAGAVLMVSSTHVNRSPSTALASRRRWLPFALDATPTAGGGVLSAAFRF